MCAYDCVLVPDEQKTLMTQRQAAALLACVVFCLSRLRVSNTAPASSAFTPIRRSAQRHTQYIHDRVARLTPNQAAWIAKCAEIIGQTHQHGAMAQKKVMVS